MGVRVSDGQRQKAFDQKSWESNKDIMTTRPSIWAMGSTGILCHTSLAGSL